jgi:hypothetical protein
MRQDVVVLRNAKDYLDAISRLLYGSSFGAILLCVILWIRAKTVGEDERGNAERRAIFVGLWPPTLWLIGDTLARHRPRRARGLLRSLLP